MARSLSIQAANSAARTLHRRRAIFITFGLLALGALAGRLYLPYWLAQRVNSSLARIPNYYGQIEKVRVHLWRGAYSIENLRLVKMTGKVPVPFFRARTVDLSVQWSELFRGALVGEIALDKPVLNFVNAKSRSAQQTTIDRSWQSAVRDLFPLRFNHFRGTEGEIHFRDFERNPPVDIVITNLHFRGDNLTNDLGLSNSLIADISAQGTAEGQAPVKMHVRLDPFQERPAFRLEASIKSLQLTKLNDFFQAYANFDVQDGSFEMYTELQSDGKKFEGYSKPFLKDTKVLSLEADASNPLRVVWEAIVGFVTEIVENQGEEQIAAKIPISGRFSERSRIYGKPKCLYPLMHLYKCILII